MLNKGQGAIEYLLIIAAAILVVAIVILAVTGALEGGQEQTSQGITNQVSAVNQLKESSGRYFFLNNRYYLKSSSIGESISVVWEFNQNSVDLSGSGFDLDEGNATEVDGLWGTKAYSFNGSSEWLGRRDTSLVEEKSEFTISIWFKPNVIQDGMLFSEGVPDVIFNVFVLSNNGIKVGMWNKDNSVANWEYAYSEINLIKVGEWHNVVFSIKDGAAGMGDCKMYLNGILLTTTGDCQMVHHPTAGQYIAVGNNVGSVFGSQGPNYFNGIIEEVIVWDKALTEDEVKELWDNIQ